MKKKTNHKIMKKRKTKRNTKRKINKKYRSFKKRKTFKRNKKIRFTRKKLYGGADSSGGTGISENLRQLQGCIVDIISQNPMSVLARGTDFSSDKKYENLDPNKANLNLRVVDGSPGYFGKKLKLPMSQDSLEGGDKYKFFRFYHDYGCVLSVESLYKLYLNGFFHTIYEQIAIEEQLVRHGSFGPDYVAGYEPSEDLYTRMIATCNDKYPGCSEIKGLAVLFYKLKHLCADIEVTDIPVYNIWNFVQYILVVFTNAVIYTYLKKDQETSKSSPYRIILMTINNPKNKFIENIKKLISLLNKYINSEIFLEYIQGDYEKFNLKLQGGIFHLEKVEEMYQDYTLENLKSDLEGTGDPILSLEVGGRHPNTLDEEGVPPAEAVAEAHPPAPEPAPA